MDLGSNPRAAAAQRIQAQTGLDVLDDAAVERAVAVCAAQRSRARRAAVISGLLLAAVVTALAVAAAIGTLHGYEFVLGPVVLLLNGYRMVRAVAGARKLTAIGRGIEAARTEVQAAAAVSPGHPAGQPGPARPAPPDVARWN